VFYPAVVILFIGIVVLAYEYRPSGVEPIVTDTEFVMSGPALSQLVPGPGTAVQFVTATGQPSARMTATASIETAGNLSAGIAAIMPAEFETAVLGRVIRVETEWRAADQGGLSSARLGYFTTGGGDSGWRALPVSSQFKRVGFCFEVSPNAPTNGIESMGIWPDENGSSRALIVREMRTSILPPGTTFAECQETLPVN
jgi:hypothetical protein